MWLFGKYRDLGLLFLPVWLSLAVVFSLPADVLNMDFPLWAWVVLVLGIDVTHVWSTLFRTYLNKKEFQSHKTLLILAPIGAFILLFGIARESTAAFWTVMAYLAVFHFVKQQYGFLALYTAKRGRVNVKRIISDKFAMYTAMVFPIIYWHLNDRAFSWFVAGDFFHFPTAPTWLNLLLEIAYWIVLVGWCFEEIKAIRSGQAPKAYGRFLWLITTIAVWYGGIVWLNSDIAFSVTNIVAHGVPYLVLIAGYKIKQKGLNLKDALAISLLIVSVSLVFAFVEEYFWDMLVNREKSAVFEWLKAYWVEQQSIPTSICLALLSLPQVVHYIVDGFIWKMNDANPDLKKLL